MNEFEAAIRQRHNGYNPEARAGMPLLREPETPEQALEELISEANDLGLAEGKIQAEEQVARLERRLERCRTALKNIQSQCHGHADEFSRNVWVIADTVLNPGAAR